ncbi:MAG TPA: amidohydrolase family protein [Gemmataceae bacterium]|nr:amidohydrolase family protein [Gemmataceae bacterium]
MKMLFRVVLLVVSLLTATRIRAQDLLVQAGKVYTMTGPPFTPGAVLISNGKIVQVGAKLTAPAGAKVIDLGSGVLMPGLIDAYSSAGIAGHAEEITREITPAYRVLAAVDWRARAFRELLAEGTTSLGLAPGTDGVFAGLSCVLKTAGERRVLVQENGLVITMASDPANGNSSRGRPDSIYVRQPTNRMGVVWLLRSTFDAANRGKSSELQVVREALAGKRRIYAVSRTENDLLSLLRIAKEFQFTPTLIGGHEAHKIRKELAAAKVPVILGPLTSFAGLVGTEDSEIVWNQPSLLQKAGIPFALSGGALLDQARFAVRYGLPADAALQAITRTPARLLGVDNRVGTLEPGHDADMIALDGDPLELTTSLKWVLVDGKLYEKVD